MGTLAAPRLHAQQRRGTLAAALQDYGRLVKTEFMLRCLTRPTERRGIHRQLNNGESIHALEDAVFYGNEVRIARLSPAIHAHVSVGLHAVGSAATCSRSAPAQNVGPSAHTRIPAVLLDRTHARRPVA